MLMFDVDAIKNLYTYHMPRALFVFLPMNQGRITEVPSPSLIDAKAEFTHPSARVTSMKSVS